MCTTSALQDADKLKVARVRFRQGTDESPLILNNELMKVESRLEKNMHVQFFLLGNQKAPRTKRGVRSLCWGAQFARDNMDLLFDRRKFLVDVLGVVGCNIIPQLEIDADFERECPMKSTVL